MKKLLYVGRNIKLSKDVATFNLPAVKTCPGCTGGCSKICYALKAEVFRKNVRQGRQDNWKISKQAGFVGHMINQISKLKTDKIRIHESGDFYNQDYLNKWVQIAKTFPNIKFLAYTKSFALLDFNNLPTNLIIYHSYMKLTADTALNAVVINKGDAIPKNYFVCSEVNSKTGHINYCGSKCNVCWTGKSNVAFPKH